MVSAPAHELTFKHRPRNIGKLCVTALLLTFGFSLPPIIAREFFSTYSGSASQETRIEPARLSTELRVRALGLGKPTISLNDGHDLLTTYVGPEDLTKALEQNLAEPLSLASADFDEDGVPDLVSGYSSDGRGIITLHRGNVDAIYPNAPEAKQRMASGTFTDAPFLSPAGVFATPIAADFIGAGDFDADGHWDAVVASRTRNSLYLMSGDGHGKLSLTKEVPLAGRVTAMTTGEINRADGLTDIVAGVDAPDGAKVMVFEGLNGALKAETEVFPMPGAVAALALGQLDSGSEMDLAVGTGTQLVVVHGRDRKLSLDNEQRKRVLPARTETRQIGSAIKSLVIGDFAVNNQTAIGLLTQDAEVEVISPGREQLTASKTSAVRISSWQSHSLRAVTSAQAHALVRAKMSSTPGDDLLLLEESGQGMRLIHNAANAASTQTTLGTLSPPVAALPMRLNSDALTDLVFLRRRQSQVAVIHTKASQTFVVNSTADTDDGQCTTAVNGCTLREAINAANANPGADGITFDIGSGVKTIVATAALPTITGPVTIDGTTQPGFAGNPIIEINGGNVSGFDVGGFNVSASNTTIRGLVVNRFPGGQVVIRGGGSGNVLEGNYLGTNITGTAGFCLDVLCTRSGANIQDNSPNNLIGGTVAPARNLISGGGRFGGEVNVTGVGNRIQGNFIGTDVSGTNLLTFDTYGVQTLAATSTTIGGTTAGSRNVIVGGGIAGVFILDSNFTGGGHASGGNLIQGNYIGIDASGSKAITNQGGGGVSLIGQDSDKPLRTVTGNTVGGTTVAARNVISGNSRFDSSNAVGVGGIFTTPNLVQGNYLGTDANGTQAIPNASGVTVSQAQGTVIGGSIPEARNIISGNLNYGVFLGKFDKFSGGIGVTVQGNFIGTNASGTGCIGNGLDGIHVDVTQVTHTIRDNLITCNGRNGITIPNISENNTSGTPGFQINLDLNLVYGNQALGIDLGDAGITPNDSQDADSGSNLLQNFPVLTSAMASAASGETIWERAGEMGREMPDPILAAALTINGTLNSAPNTNFTVHWYFSADAQCTTNQAASRPLAFGKVPNVITNGSGNAMFSIPFDFPSGIAGGIVNCTATDPQGNTSEFSACFPVGTQPGPTPTPTPSPSPTPSPRPCAGFTETFDAMVVPAIPSGWSATNASGPAPLWVTSNAGAPAPVADSLPNAAFVDDPNVVSDKRFGSPLIALTNGPAQLTFRQNRNLENTFDGGVLEISIGGAAFQDIVTAGGSFVAGGYNATLSTGFGNPLAGRQAWSGNSNGFVTTTVNLPPSAGGQNIVLRWRLGSDNAVSGQGWRIDNIAITCVSPPTIFVEQGTNNLAAVDSVTFVRGPFMLTNPKNFTSDQRTRIIIFTTNLGLPQTSQPLTSTLSVQVGVNSHPVESVGPNTTTGGSQIFFRLPDLSPGSHPLGIRLNDVNSTNSPNLIIIASPSSPATAPKSNKTKLAEYLLYPLIDLIF